MRLKIGFTKTKFGHCGTLDPFASGLVILGTDSATKNISNFTNQRKSYKFTIKLGEFTESFEPTTPVVKTSDNWKNVTLEDIINIAETFLGNQDQIVLVVF